MKRPVSGGWHSALWTVLCKLSPSRDKANHQCSASHLASDDQKYLEAWPGYRKSGIIEPGLSETTALMRLFSHYMYCEKMNSPGRFLEHTNTEYFLSGLQKIRPRRRMRVSREKIRSLRQCGQKARSTGLDAIEGSSGGGAAECLRDLEKGS